MAKKRVTKNVNEKFFLKQLTQYAKQDKTGKKTPGKTRTGVKEENRNRKNTGEKNLRSEKRIPKSRVVEKGISKSKVQISKVTGTTRRKGTKSQAETNRNISKDSLRVAKQTRKTGKQLDYSFNRVRSVDRKIQAFQEQSQKSIRKQLAKNDGKPPRGIVVVVTDKYGREAAAVSPLQFVVNEQSVEKFTTKFLKELSKDHLAWKDIQKKRRRKKKRAKEQSEDYADYLDDETGDEEGYGNYNPENISNISIKFIY